MTEPWIFEQPCIKCGVWLSRKGTAFDKRALCDGCFIDNFRALKRMPLGELETHLKDFLEGNNK